jgi:hypothetical protein
MQCPTSTVLEGTWQICLSPKRTKAKVTYTVSFHLECALMATNALQL